MRLLAALLLVVPVACTDGEDVLRDRTARIRAQPPVERTIDPRVDFQALGLSELDGDDALDELDLPLDHDADEAERVLRPAVVLDPDEAETVGAALAAAEAAAVGASLCDAAYDAVAAMAAEVRAREPDAVHPMPPRGLFVHACEQLPTAAQECLLPNHAVAHREACARATAAVPAADRERLERLLAGE
ncbi:MAG: hypothetical protein KF901_13315 [Myxococcales bacterium]|nr:hypothetical protein [Myxococcales bacterium]